LGRSLDEATAALTFRSSVFMDCIARGIPVIALGWYPWVWDDSVREFDAMMLPDQSRRRSAGAFHRSTPTQIFRRGSRDEVDIWNPEASRGSHGTRVPALTLCADWPSSAAALARSQGAHCYHAHHMMLITGASGLLGLGLVLTARDRGLPVVAASMSHPILMPDVPSLTQDVSSRDFLSQVRSLAPSSVVHCAAMTDVDGCQERPERARSVNAVAVGALARTAAECGAAFVYISTDAVFDGERGGYREADLPRPLNVYADTKLEGERAALRECPRGLIIRTNIFGWRMRKQPTLAEWVVQTLRNGQAVPGFADTVFNPILTTHVSEAILDLVERGEAGVMHVAGRDVCSKFEFARGIASVFGLPAELVVESSLGASSLRAPRPLNTSLDVSAVESVLDRPMPTLAEGLRDFKRQESNGFVGRITESLGGSS
jgi:dTDP-4-dehydrorhamnose reductase